MLVCIRHKPWDKLFPCTLHRQWFAWSFFSGCVLQKLSKPSYLLTYAQRSLWSIGDQRPPAIALCSGLLRSFRTSWSLAVSVLLQCLASNCCEAGLSFCSPAGSRSGLGVWCWMLASWGCVRYSPTSSAVSTWRKEKSLDQQGSWTCSAYTQWLPDQSRCCRSASSDILFRMLGIVFLFQQKYLWPAPIH